MEYFNKHLPDLIISPLEGTYLQWIDFSIYFQSENEFNQFNETVLKMDLDSGSLFSTETGLFQRINIAIPHEVLNDVCERISEGISSLCK